MIRNHHTRAGQPLRAPHRPPEEGEAAVASPDRRHAPAAAHPAVPAQHGTPSEGADASPFRKETSEGAESAAHSASAAIGPSTPEGSPLDTPGTPDNNEASIPGDTSSASDNDGADLPGDLPDDDEPEGDALYEHLALTVDRGQAMMRLDKYLTLRMERCSRNRIQTAADSGNVLVNGRPAKSSYKVKPLDRISLVMPYPPRETEITPQDIPLDILYEDDDLLLVNKAAGMVVHPGHGNWDGTLVNALAWHLRDEPLFQRGDIRAGLVHRIDKDTSGILVVAKNERAHALLARQFFDHSITRRYLALVWGDFAEDEGTITGHIGRSVRDKLCMQVFPDGSQGKHAVTHWRVLRRFGYVTLVECRLETGRTHQIRVHMAWTGHPLFNDARYGGDRILKGTTFSKYRQFVENCFAAMPRQALHARCLGFVHPSTRQEVYFESEPPADFRTVLERWENYTAARGENDA